MFEIHASLDVNLDPNDILAHFGLEDHGRVQKAIDNAVIRYMEPYWACDRGILKQNATAATDIGSGIITYQGPYAHYMYYGVVYGPNYPKERDSDGNVVRWWSPPGQRKHPTGKKLHYKGATGSDGDTQSGPGPGSFPFERMKADHLEDILEEARRVARDQ